MMMEKEDLGLSLSLSSSTNTNHFPPPHQLSLLPSTLSSASQPNPLSFPFCHQNHSQWSHDLLPLPHSERRPALNASGGAGEMRPLLRVIDVNRAPSVGVGAAERDSEEEAAASSPNSTVSSASGKRRERDPSQDGGDEHDVDRAYSRGISDEEDGEGSRKKLRLSKDQSAILEESFKEHNTLNPKQKLALAKQLNLRPRQVEVWFQNRRARTKLKQTEVDCEFLKRCCENLTEENRRLQKEVHELRALKLSPQFYMHMTPPTTLTMCPSCERVSNFATNSTSSASTNPPLPEHPQFLHHHRSVNATAPWAPIPLRPPFIDAPPQRS